MYNCDTFWRDMSSMQILDDQISSRKKQRQKNWPRMSKT